MSLLPKRGPRKAPADLEVSERGPKAAATEELYAGAFEKALKIVEERLSGDPFGGGSMPIQFNRPDLVGRWFNAEIKADHIWRAVDKLGWVRVRPTWLADPSQLGGSRVSPDGYIVRGDKGAEHLLCMPQEAYDKTQLAKAQSNLGKMTSQAAMKDAAANATAERYGDEAADHVHEHMTVRESVERHASDVDPRSADFSEDKPDA